MQTENAHKTAMRRKTPSVTARMFMRDIAPRVRPVSVMDYGCGWGRDVEAYRAAGFSAYGYDPHPQFGQTDPHAGKKFDVVFVTYVLNALDTYRERVDVLCRAKSYMHANSLLIVTTRTPEEIEREALTRGWAEEADGYRTKSGTFQAGIGWVELMEMGASVGLDVKPEWWFVTHENHPSTVVLTHAFLSCADGCIYHS